MPPTAHAPRVPWGEATHTRSSGQSGRCFYGASPAGLASSPVHWKHLPFHLTLELCVPLTPAGKQVHEVTVTFKRLSDVGSALGDWLPHL